MQQAGRGGDKTWELREQMKAMGLGTQELMMKGYMPEAPSWLGSRSIISLSGKGWDTFWPGFQLGLGDSTFLTLAIPDMAGVTAAALAGGLEGFLWLPVIPARCETLDKYSCCG